MPSPRNQEIPAGAALASPKVLYYHFHAASVGHPLACPGPAPEELSHCLRVCRTLDRMQGGYGTSWRDGSMGRSGSFGMGKLESLELPDAVAAVAMLHDMPPEQRAGHMPPLPRSNSGLGVHAEH